MLAHHVALWFVWLSLRAEIAQFHQVCVCVCVCVFGVCVCVWGVCVCGGVCVLGYTVMGSITSLSPETTQTGLSWAPCLAGTQG